MSMRMMIFNLPEESGAHALAEGGEAMTLAVAAWFENVRCTIKFDGDLTDQGRKAYDDLVALMRRQLDEYNVAHLIDL